MSGLNRQRDIDRAMLPPVIVKGVVMMSEGVEDK